MIRQVSKTVLVAAARQVARLPLTRRAMHRLSVAARGPSLAFLRCRRLLPDTAAGKRHIDRQMGGAMLGSELHAALRSIQKTLRFIHPGEALAALERGDRLPEGAAVLTFDESFALTAEVALPILRELQVPALFFVTTEHLDGGRTLWDQEVHTVFERVAPASVSVPWMDRVLRTSTPAQRAKSVRRLLLSMIPLDEVKLNKRLRDLYQRLELAPEHPPLDRMLKRHEVRRLAHDPLVSFGAHGHRHFALSGLSPEALEEELGRPREILRELCGGSFIDVVSYPFGRAPYFDDSTLTAARLAGYRAGFCALPGVCRPGDHLYSLPRLPLGPGVRATTAYELQGVSDAVDELLLVVSGAEDRVIAELEG